MEGLKKYLEIQVESTLMECARTWVNHHVGHFDWDAGHCIKLAFEKRIQELRVYEVSNSTKLTQEALDYILEICTPARVLEIGKALLKRQEEQEQDKDYNERSKKIRHQEYLRLKEEFEPEENKQGT